MKRKSSQKDTPKQPPRLTPKQTDKPTGEQREKDAPVRRTSRTQAAPQHAAPRKKTAGKQRPSGSHDDGKPQAGSRPLIIVESPTKARTIGKFLGTRFGIRASSGHIMDLPKAKLGVTIENNFEPEYVLLPNKSKALKEIKQAAERASEIYLAPDPDREGEAIAWHLQTYLGDTNSRTKRLVFYEVTKEALQEALDHPQQVDMKKVDAQQARRVLDRLVGYLVSPFLWTTLRYGLSAGRVQSVALRLICEREEEISAFVTREYWSLEAEVEGRTKEPFKARLITIDGKKIEIGDDKSAQSLAGELREQAFSVDSVREDEKKRNPFPPFTTSTLQQEASKRLRFSGKRTMSIAQELYEGIDLGPEGQVGLITYMRTDSIRSSAQSIEQVRNHVRTSVGDAYLPDSPRVYTSKSRTQGAHEAIRPTSVVRTPEQVARFLAEPQLSLYRLIWNRFVASQMAVARYHTTSADIKAGRFMLRASGTRMTFDGFTRIYKDVERAKDTKPELLPVLERGEALTLRKLDTLQHFTEPPPRYTEGTIVRVLDENGIGRPSTYATIIGTILARKYVASDAGRLRPTELGMVTCKLLVKAFPDIFNIEFTANMEDNLDLVEAGEKQWVEVVREFYEPFHLDLEKAEKTKSALKAELITDTGLTCKLCGKKMVKKFGRNGTFLACSGYPECKFTMPVETDSPQSVTDEKCDACGSPMTVREGRYGRFLSCSKYPECKATKPMTLGIDCPQEGCGGKLVEKRSRAGKVFYGCSKYPACKFASWDMPIKQECPECGYPTMVEKITKRKGRTLRCLGCKHELSG
ncbi:MAG: type I DNA topoisomerase [Candidatus Eisenbacteria bacterium]|nr:type I DNA topoisomerase [Candidatus Eisenbacteria bacterium]